MFQILEAQLESLELYRIVELQLELYESTVSTQFKKYFT